MSRLHFGCLSRRNRDKDLLLRLLHQHLVWKRRLGTRLASWVVRKHDGDAHAKHALAKSDVADGGVNVLPLWLTRLDHVAVGELHGLCTSATDLASNHALNTLGSALHHEADNTVASATHCKATNELIAQRLALGDSTEAAVGDFLSVQLNRVLGEVPPLLDNSGEFANTTALLAKNILRPRRTDNNLSPHGRDTNLNTRVAILGELTSQQLIELSKEDAIGDKLPLLADLCRHFT
mmetsp:Transcript_653/g.1191  ORF Transcript_653/g.1191 Transcript_653/m.1191 type:complete len:236 (+) Transcript_653:281-988(+)